MSNRSRGFYPSGCPFCSGRNVCSCRSLAARRLDLMEQWDYAANDGLDPEQTGVRSKRKVFWMCSQHGPWLARVTDRSAGSGCPKCATNSRARNRTRRGLLKDEHPQLAAQLHPTKNEHVDLDKTTSGSNIKAVWVCNDRHNAPPGCTHAHEWTTRILQHTGQKGSGCPFCSGLKVCLCNSLAVKAPEVAAEWHPTRNGGSSLTNLVFSVKQKCGGSMSVS